MMKFGIILILASVAGAQVTSVTNEAFPQFRIDMNSNFSYIATQLLKTSYVAGTGTAQAQVATFSPAIASLASIRGIPVCWLPAAANSAAAPTLAINGLSATAITKLGTTALVANDITTTAVACVIYDGTEFQLENPQTLNIPATACSGQFVSAITAGTGAGTCSPLTAAELAGSATPGTSVTLSGPAQIYFCTGTCTVGVPVPQLNFQFCVIAKGSTSAIITLTALGSSSMYQKTDRSAYGTAATGTLVSTAAVGNFVCIVGSDSTHYETVSFKGAWTAN